MRKAPAGAFLISITPAQWPGFTPPRWPGFTPPLTLQIFLRKSIRSGRLTLDRSTQPVLKRVNFWRQLDRFAAGKCMEGILIQPIQANEHRQATAKRLRDRTSETATLGLVLAKLVHDKRVDAVT